MPITGFLEGYNEQRKVEQTLEDQRQLAGLRATEIAANVNKLQTDLAVKSTLANIFMGPSPAQKDPNAGPDDVLADRLNRAGAAVMSVDPTKGLAFTNAAANIQQKKALAKKEELQTQEKARDEQGGVLGAIQDQESYDTLLPKALNLGWKLPPWYTGNYEKDKVKLAAEANATMKVSEQARVQQGIMTAEARLNTQQRLAEAAAAKAEIDTMKLALQQQTRETANRAEDRRQAQGRERLNRAALPGDADIRAAKDALEARNDVPVDLNPNAKKEIIRRAATEGKRNALRNDTDVDEEINNSLGRILREDVEPGKKKEYGLPFGLMPSLTLWTKAGEPTLKTKNSAKPTEAPTERVDSSGGVSQLPKVGEVRKGYRFKGGDPSKPTSWEKV